MMQMINITNARRGLSGLVDRVAKGEEGVVIVSDSEPKVVLMPYRKVLEEEYRRKNLWRERFAVALKQGKNDGRKWARVNKIGLKTMSEEQKYELVAGM